MITRSFSKSFSFGNRPGSLSSDPYWNNVLSYLKFETNLYDEKKGVLWWSTVPGPVYETANPLYGIGSLTIGTSGYAIKSSNDSSQWNTIPATFTVEMYVKIVSTFGGLEQYINEFGDFNRIKIGGGGSSPQVVAHDSSGNKIFSTTLVLGQKYHVAMTRENNIVSLWIDGELQGTAAGNASIDASAGLQENNIFSNGAFGGNVILDNYRLTGGINRYPTAFTLQDIVFN